MTFWGIISSFIFMTSVSHADCMSTDEIRATIEDFKMRAKPLMSTFLLPTEIVYNDVAILQNDPITAFTYIADSQKIHVGVAGQQCLNTFSRDEMHVILCHELGHIAGGAPFMSFIGHSPNVFSAEGQADFFATASCLPAIFARDDNRQYVEQLKGQPDVAVLCTQHDEQERGLCARVMMASLRFIQFIHLTPNMEKIPFSKEDQGPLPTLLGKDLRVVPKTLLREYPSTQCRLQTMVAGFQCQAQKLLSNFSLSPDVDLSCGETAQSVQRPRCWYNPQN